MNTALRRLQLYSIAVIAALVWLSAPAAAFTIANNTVGIGTGDINDSFDITWSKSLGGGYPDLTATSTWTVIGFTSTALTLGISIKNTTPDQDATPGPEFQSSITTFGVGVDPNVTAAFATNGEGNVFDTIGAGSGPNQTFPGGFKGIDVCISESQCGGGAFQDGLLSNVTDTITIVLSGVFGDDPFATLAFFPIKFQTNIGSFEFGGQVPLPASLPLLMSALLGLAMFRKRRKNPSTAAENC